jgi:DNA-binding transcriptional LysR family regulator
VPTFVVCDALRSGVLRALFMGVGVAPVHLHAVYPSRDHLHPTTAAFVKFLAERFSRDVWSKA